MPSIASTRRLVHVLLLLGLASVMTMMFASNRDKFEGRAIFLPFGLFNRSIGQKYSLLDPHDMGSEQNAQDITTESQLSPLDSLVESFYQDLQSYLQDNDIDDLFPSRDKYLARSWQNCEQDEQDHYGMSNKQNSQKLDADQKKHRSWGDFLFDLLERSDDCDQDNIKLLQPRVLDRTGHEYRRCAELCDFYFHSPYPICRQSFFPDDDPQRRQRYCSACHSELIREAKKRAESLLEGVSCDAAIEGCWDSNGILHQPGEEFMEKCNWCSCGWGGMTICTLAGC
mmetsp:Transcript_32368/g.71480  ORF Transcript_32368/g.71480 Transcript_32368/m.71480 type:complete len:284 (+) Transcript_32368:527-1378(+)